MSVQNLVLLGATGSIGASTLSVVREHPDRFRVVGLAAHSKVEEFCAIAREFPRARLALFDEPAAKRATQELGRAVACGMDGLLDLVADLEATTLVNGLVGSIGCLPTMEAIRRGLRVCLANKETLVMAGELINRLLDEHPNSCLVPIDSEHSALHQCLGGTPTTEVESLILTASGGPFRDLPASEFANITVEQALKHPTWTMGPKITIDSSTLFNKGLEVIEAHHLFRVGYDRIQVLVHPGSHVHSLVQFQDGALVAQLGTPDMRLPILYSLVAPERVALSGDRLDLAKLGTLRFQSPDHERFPALGLAFEAGRRGGAAPAVLNAANEAAVALFLDRQIPYMGIVRLVERCLSEQSFGRHPDLEELLAADSWARRRVLELAHSEAGLNS
ncbi:MAG: 1-deoxy-D-xylulose-5-phosphate reductoisomerase [Fibrobacterota bacterium]|nr:MAG: 1-deoxy-D-xylulose-5-phosphate reductoisomerase [Fibrobacterota bacterium]